MDDIEIRFKYDECIYVKYLSIDTICTSFDMRKFTISLRNLELYSYLIIIIIRFGWWFVNCKYCISINGFSCRTKGKWNRWYWDPWMVKTYNVIITIKKPVLVYDMTE